MKDTTDRSQKEKQQRRRWVLRTFITAVILSAALSFASGEVLQDATYLAALAVLALFILLGILFDVIGVSAAAADPKSFHAMASHRTSGAKEAIWLLKNAEKVSSFCNDVVGDICGIVSGSTAAVIVRRLNDNFSVSNLALSIAVTALISGLTIGGKALGKNLAIRRSKDVVYLAARVLHFFRIVR